MRDTQNWQEICNEICILLGGYHMIVFSDFVSDESVTDSGKNLKTEVGWSLVACLAANLAFNISLILKETVLKVID